MWCSDLRENNAKTYQKYLNIAFKICPSLEFEESDFCLNRLFEQAVDEDSLDPLELAMLMSQYANADPDEREGYRNRWVETILTGALENMCPTPWQIIESLFLH